MHSSALLPRFELSSRPGVCVGELEIEISFVPADEANRDPVGKERNEPNKDPFLDPHDPVRSPFERARKGGQISASSSYGVQINDPKR